MSKKNKKDAELARVLVLGGGIGEQIQRAGGQQLYIGYTDDKAVELVESAHAVVLTGGVDVDPKLYGHEPHKATQHPNKARDLTEARVLKAAWQRGIPVLGICRGSQMINVAFGGSLHQHIADLPNTHRYHLGHDHRVDLVKGSRVRNAFKKAEAWVTSIHHQAVDTVAPGFRVNARSKDGIVEGIEIEDPERWIVGVQFHPEIGTNETLQGLFNALVREAARKAGLPQPVVRPVPRRVVDTTTWGKAPVSKISNPISKKEVDARKDEIKRVNFRSQNSGVTSWLCFRCGIEFEDRTDHLDHMWFIHDVDLLENMSDRDINTLLDN